VLLAALVAAVMPIAVPAMASVHEIERHQYTPELARMHLPDPERASIYLLSCMAFLSEDLLGPALDACNHSVESNPGDAQALRVRGSIFLLSGESERAAVDFSLAIGIEPGNVAGYELRGRAYFAMRLFKESLGDFDAAVALDPKDADIFDARASAFQALLRYRQAIADFGRAIALAPDYAAAWNARCWVRMLANTELSGALSDCLHATKLDPDAPHAFDSLGWVYLRLGDSSGALRSFDVALAKSPRLASSLYGRGLARMRLGDFRHGAKDVAAAKMLEPGIAQRFGSYGLSPGGSPVHRKSRSNGTGAS
jgi:tetratricopeptide (TPR) repeat protein